MAALNLAAIKARQRRLHELSNGFAAELVRMAMATGPLQRDEQRRYMNGIAQAHEGVQQALLGLANGILRLERKAGQ